MFQLCYLKKTKTTVISKMLHRNISTVWISSDHDLNLLSIYKCIIYKMFLAIFHDGNYYSCGHSKKSTKVEDVANTFNSCIFH